MTLIKTILLCDDELHILRAAEFKFQRAGFRVLCAEDGEEGWELMQEHLPDVVVTDLQMPRLDGIGLAERMKHDPRTAPIPVVMVTAKGFEISAEEYRERYGIRQVLHKPFSPRELMRTVEQILQETPLST